MRDRERRLQRVAALLAAGRDGTVLPDDIGRGLTPVGWAAFHRAAERIDRLRATTRDGLAQVESRITLLGELAERHRTTALCALLAADLEYRLEAWAPRRGRAGAADRALGRWCRRRGLLGARGGPAPAPRWADRRAAPALRNLRAPSPARAGDRGRRVRRGVRRRSAPSRPPRPRGPLPGGPRAAHRSDQRGLADPPAPAHRIDGAVRGIRGRDRGQLPPRGGSGGGELVSYLPGRDPIATRTNRYLWYRSRGWEGGKPARGCRFGRRPPAAGLTAAWATAAERRAIALLRKQRVDDARTVAAPAAAWSLLREGCWSGRRDSNPRPSAWEAAWGAGTGSPTLHHMIMDHTCWEGARPGTSASRRQHPVAGGEGGVARGRLG